MKSWFLMLRCKLSINPSSLSTFETTFEKIPNLRLLLIIVCFLGSFQTWGQQEDIYKKYNIYRNPVKVFLNQLSWTLTTGYGRTYSSHDLSGFYFYQSRDGQYILPSSSVFDLNFQGYANWLNNPTLGAELPVRDPFDVPFPNQPSPVLNPELANAQFFANGDTTEIGFSGLAHSIPITFQVHFNFMEKFRIGLGYSWEKQYTRELLPTNYQRLIQPYQPNYESTTYSKLFGTVGYQFYSYFEHLFVAELQIGKITTGPELNQAALQQSLYVNFGISIEKQLGEYFRIIGKPSIDFRNYKIAIPGGGEVLHKQPTLLLQVGVSINIPEIPRSPISNDKIQLKHVITDPKTGRLIEVRGQPITKWQNPKVGQNHRKLLRYRGRNKKKLNPF